MSTANECAVPSKSWKWDYNGHESDVVFMEYGNANLLVLTQLQTMGTMLLARCEHCHRERKERVRVKQKHRAVYQKRFYTLEIRIFFE